MPIDAVIQRALLRLILALPAPVRRWIAGPPRVQDGQTLDLDAQLLARLDQMIGSALAFGDGSPKLARAGMRRGAHAVAGRRIPVADVRDELVAGAAGPVRARRFIPHGLPADGGAPLIVYYHGGGWVLGDLDTHDNTCRALAQACGAVVVSVDYRLAPEHPYPAAIDDAVAAFEDLRSRAQSLGADPERVVVAGDSAGGHLSAMVCLRAVAAGMPAPAAQVLVYPVCDLVEHSASYYAFSEGLLLTEEEMVWFKERFTPDPLTREEASPLFAPDLAGLPPALVLTAGFDPLRDEGEAYAARLADAGVTVQLRRYPGQVHGFLNMLGVGTVAHEAIGEIAGTLRLWLGGVGTATGVPEQLTAR